MRRLRKALPPPHLYVQIHFSLLLFPPTVFPRQLSSVSLALLRLTRISVQLHPPPSPPPPPPSIVASSHRRRNRDKISPHKCEPCKGFGWIFSLFFFSLSRQFCSLFHRKERILKTSSVRSAQRIAPPPLYSYKMGNNKEPRGVCGFPLPPPFSVSLFRK